MKRKKPLYVYEVGIPVEEIWVMEVVAENRKEAKRLASMGKGEQTCSVSGGKGWVSKLRRASEGAVKDD